jgi:hypothetical protein
MGALADFLPSLGENRVLVLMPISRLLVEERIEVGSFRIYPPGQAEIDELRLIPNEAFPDTQDLRQALSSLTGITAEVIESSPLIGFSVALDWDCFLRADHSADKALLRKLSQEGEKAMDIVRLEFCRLDPPDTLPGRVGSWVDSGQHVAALLYQSIDHESYLIAGPAITTAIVQGIGLDLDLPPSRKPPDSGEVGALVQHALALFRDALETSNETHRFTRVMTLLEFLASPDSFQKMQDVKREIATHFANNANTYQRVLERFRELTSKEENGTQTGLRTLIVHHGRYLEDLIPQEQDRRTLFRELQSYAHAVIDDMLLHSGFTWEQFLQFRKEKRQSILVV